MGCFIRFAHVVICGPVTNGAYSVRESAIGAMKKLPCCWGMALLPMFICEVELFIAATPLLSRSWARPFVMSSPREFAKYGVAYCHSWLTTGSMIAPFAFCSVAS